MKAPFIGLHIFVYCSCPIGLKVIRGWIFFLCNAFHFVDLVSDCCVGKTFGKVEITDIGWFLIVISYVTSSPNILT